MLIKEYYNKQYFKEVIDTELFYFVNKIFLSIIISKIILKVQIITDS